MNPALLRNSLILCLLLIITPVHADELSVYNAFLSSGSSIHTASANSMLILDNGLLSMWSNPAGLLTTRHQIYADATISGAYSTQTNANPSGAEAGVGMVGYLYSMSNSVFALGYTPRNVLQASAEFDVLGSNIEARHKLSYSEITASYARRLGNDFTAGISAGPIIGRGSDGAISSPADMDTLYNPLLWFARIGIKQQREHLSWGIAVEAPAMGKFTVERPVNVGFQRDKLDVDYSGALGIRAGIGWQSSTFGIESDVLYYNMDMVQVDGESANFESSLISFGVAGKMQLNELIGLRSGIRIRQSDPYDQTFVQIGFGGSYILSPELTVFGGFGMMLPSGDSASSSLPEDLRPLTLRAGVMFHSDPE